MSHNKQNVHPNWVKGGLEGPVTKRAAQFISPEATLTDVTVLVVAMEEPP